MRFLLVFALMGWPVATTSAVDVYLFPVADTTLNHDELGINYGSESTIACHSWRRSGDDEILRQAILRFDFSGIPVGARITAAKLYLLSSRDPSEMPGETLVTVHWIDPLLGAWAEDKATGGTPLHPTWDTALRAPEARRWRSQITDRSIIGDWVWPFELWWFFCDESLWRSNPGFVVSAQPAVVVTGVDFHAREANILARPVLALSYVVDSPPVIPPPDSEG